MGTDMCDSFDVYPSDAEFYMFQRTMKALDKYFKMCQIRTSIMDDMKLSRKMIAGTFLR